MSKYHLLRLFKRGNRAHSPRISVGRPAPPRQRTADRNQPFRGGDRLPLRFFPAPCLYPQFPTGDFYHPPPVSANTLIPPAFRPVKRHPFQILKTHLQASTFSCILKLSYRAADQSPSHFRCRALRPTIPFLRAQFLRGYTDLEILKNIRPEDIEDISERFLPCGRKTGIRIP